MSDKLRAFRDFDFDGSTEWQKYFSNLEFPANKQTPPVVDKFKAKWYQRNIDPDFDVASAQQSGAPPSQTHESSSEIPSNGSHGTQVPPANGSRPNTQSRPSPTPTRPGFLGKVLRFLASTAEDRLFFLHSALLLFAILHLQPFSRYWSARAWGYFTQTALLAHAYKVYLRYGRPQLRPFSLQNIKTWLMPVSSSTDFQYVLLSSVFIPSKPVMLVMVPFVTLAVYHLAAYGARNYSHTLIWQKYFSPIYGSLVAKQQEALVYNAAAEIGSGFLVVLGLISPPRNFFLIFIYWQFLRMRYWSPDSANNHRLVWGQLDARVGRYLDYVPILKTPVAWMQRYFANAPGVPAGR